MEQETLQIFCRQLGCWIEDLLARGRYPFRRLDLAPSLMTEAGEMSPDLVLWINRDSFMAGGLLLITAGKEAEDLERGRLCATVLGLRHFLTWGASELVFWEIHRTAVSRHRTLPAPPSGSEPAVYRKTLIAALEELKFLAVSGTLEPAALSAHYLANLCRDALTDVHPALEGARRASAEPSSSGPEAQKRLSHDKAFLTLLRLLVLHHFDQMPTAVQPEGLERALIFALDSLPDHLRSPLLPQAAEVPLPLDCAVRFHHLLRRLTQVGAEANRSHTAEILELLLPAQGIQIGACPVPVSSHSPSRSRLEVNRLPSPPGAADWQCAPASILAAAALLRELAGQPPAREQATDLFAWSRLPRPDEIVACLGSRDVLSKSERQTALARLRLSWPTRRLALPAGAPRWAWEWLHLAGLAPDGAELTLYTPDGWMQTPFAPALLQNLHEQFRLREVRRTEGGQLMFSLRKGEEADTPVTVTTAGGSRQVDAALLKVSHPACLSLALHLPEELWRPIEDGLLRFPTDSTWPEPYERAIWLYTRSRLGRFLWRLLAGSQSLPPASRLRQVILSRGLPLPHQHVLQHLLSLDDGPQDAGPAGARIDQELALWFPASVAGLHPPAPERRPAKRCKQRTTASIAEELKQEVFIDGLPRFPDHYLYAHFRPELQGYHFLPPLTEKEEFFGRVRFQDASGQEVEAENRALADALRLVAATGRGQTELPVDQELMVDILDRYLADLRRLHRQLSQKAHTRLREPGPAQEVTGTIWRSLNLPPPELFATGTSTSDDGATLSGAGEALPGKGFFSSPKN